MVSIGVSSLIESIDYSQYSNRLLLVIPAALLVLALLVLGGWTVMTGSPVVLGVEFVGGTEIRVAENTVEGDTYSALESAFAIEPNSIQTVPSDRTYIVTFKSTGLDVDELETQAESAGFEVRSSSEISPSFGSDTQRLALFGVLAAFFGMGLVVLFLFRTIVPSFTVVASAFSDMIVPLAFMNLVGIDLSLGTVAALLMLIGYSVDSDILLTDYVVRRGGEFYGSVADAMDTGLTMTLTSLLVMVVMTIAAIILGAPLLRDIGLVLAVGLIVDILNTYMMNVSLLRWYRFEGVKYNSRFL